MSSTGSSLQPRTASRAYPAASRRVRLRTGVRSARVAFGFALYTLILGSALTASGAIIFIIRSHWLLLALVVLIEAIFILGFLRLARLARNRKPYAS